MNKAFENVSYNKIKLTFPNGNSISTIWSQYSYSDNYDGAHKDMIKGFTTFSGSDTCEIMILEAPDKLIKKIHKKYDGDGSVIGYLKMNEWLDIIKLLSK